MVIWYDNEWGYSNRVLDISRLILKKMSKNISALLIGKKLVQVFLEKTQ